MALFWTEHLQRLRDALDAQTDLVRVSSAHSTIKGSSIELVIKQLLQGYLPKMFCVGTGQIANRRNELSPQIDIIVYDAPTFPHLAVNVDSSVIVCTESVAAVVECKYTWPPRRSANIISVLPKRRRAVTVYLASLACLQDILSSLSMQYPTQILKP